MGFPARRRDRPAESQVSPRAEWYDRNPSVSGLSYAAAGVSPHALTLRGSYTVPSGRKAMFSFCQVLIYRDAAPTTAGRIRLYADAYACRHMLLVHYNATVGSKEVTHHPIGVLFSEGQSADLYSEDVSTGGTMWYATMLSLCEFDA